MIFTDSRGESQKVNVCGYTESLSGYTNIIIENDEVVVEDNCT